MSSEVITDPQAHSATSDSRSGSAEDHDSSLGSLITAEQFSDIEWNMVHDLLSRLTVNDDDKQLVLCRLYGCDQTFECSHEDDIVEHLASECHDELRNPNGPYLDNWKVYCLWRMNDHSLLVCGQTLTASEFAAHIQQEHLPETIHFASSCLENIHSRADQPKPRWCA